MARSSRRADSAAKTRPARDARTTPASSARREDGTTSTPDAGRRVILSPVLDVLNVGGLSLLLMVPLLLSGRSDLVLIGAGAQAWIATAINMPHFMASYRLVYGSRDMIRRHMWAAVWLPLLMVAYLAIAVWSLQYTRDLVTLFITVSSLYLAWHYTGQVWGMMASFAHLRGESFTNTERRLIRTSLRILLAWHVTWFLYTQLRDAGRVALLYQVLSAATVVAFLLGAEGLRRMAVRTKRWPSPLAMVAWVSIFVWYATMARDPKALFWVQIAHAIQYLAFPIRMELNHAAQAPHASRARTAWHMGLYGVLLLGVSVLMAQVVPRSLMGVVGGVFGEEPGNAMPILILMFINIHHYFTDGVLWKLRNPEVRRHLFAHLAPAT